MPNWMAGSSKAARQTCAGQRRVRERNAPSSTTSALTSNLRCKHCSTIRLCLPDLHPHKFTIHPLANTAEHLPHTISPASPPYSEKSQLSKCLSSRFSASRSRTTPRRLTRRTSSRLPLSASSSSRRVSASDAVHSISTNSCIDLEWKLTYVGSATS
jgi:hypothetical protein